jgi:hypothetical protein
LEEQWAKEENPLEKILEEISKKSNKTKYAKPIAKTLTDFPDEKYRYPKLVRKLFEKMSDDLGLLKKDFS